MFNLSVLEVLGTQPWRWTTQPDVEGNGGVKQTLSGVFILMSDEIVAYLRATMTQAEKDEVAPWVNRYSEAQCNEWHVPVWAGQDSAVYWRIPAAIWNDPAAPPPQKVKTYFRELFREGN